MQVANAMNLPDSQESSMDDIRWMNYASLLLAVVLLGMGITLVAQRIARLPYFTVRRVQVEGELVRNNLATLRANILPRLQGSFLQMDLGKAREVFESVPWVRKAVVRRVWPNELRVQLEEHHPVAYWQHADRDDELVNQQGEVFDANLGDVEEHLPSLAGPSNPSADQARQMLEMLHRLQPVFAELGDIDTLRLTERGSWSVVLDNDAEIALGRGESDDVVARASRFVRTLPQVHQRYPGPMTYADLRYADGYAIRLRGTTTLSEEASQGSANDAPKEHEEAHRDAHGNTATHDASSHRKSGIAGGLNGPHPSR